MPYALSTTSMDLRKILQPIENFEKMLVQVI